MNRLRRTAVFLALGLLVASTAEAKKAKADLETASAPALWRVSDDDSAIYLFGAIGLSPEGSSWRSRAVARAIDGSETIWFEAPVDEPSAQAAANRLFGEEGMLAGGKRLSSMLPLEASAALATVTELAGLTAETLEPLKPWAAFVVLSSRVESNAERDSVDAALRREARGRGRQLRYFDTVEESLRLLTAMPQGEQVDLVSQLIVDFERQRNGARAGLDAWRTGDLEAADAYLNEPLREAAPEVYKTLVTDRVDALAADIGAILKAPETAFVSLNASYVVGPGSLPERLAEAGYKVERVAE